MSVIAEVRTYVRGHRMATETRATGATRSARQREGIAICACGTFSPRLPNTLERQRWHRRHKAAVIAGKDTL